MRIIVGLDNETDMKQVEKDLTSSGMTIDQSFQLMRIVTGFAETTKQLENVDGVIRISESKNYKLEEVKVSVE